MFQKFYPDLYISSTYEIDFDRLYRDGYRGLIFDIGFATCLISNNQEPRVKPFADAVQSMYIYDAHKPSTKNYEKAMERMHTDKKNTIFIGDQMFTDVFGANRTGIPSIMVKKIHWKEEIQIVLKRRLEAIVLISYRNYRKTHRSIFENREEEK